MAIERLSLTHFRSYADAAILPGPALNVLTGENGAGKTNVLEALSLLAPGRGLRGAALADMAASGGPGGFAVAARIETAGIGIGAEAGSPERRIVRIDGKAAAATALSEHIALVWITPAMDRLFTDAAGERRRFLDRLVLALDPLHARHSARYEAAMRQRNRLLADERPADPAWLTALEAQMAEHGGEIALAREYAIAALAERLGDAPAGPFARAGVAIEGGEGATASELASARPRDAAAGRTLAGPHRADLIVTHRDKAQPAARCSTGEQKALLLGIVLAHADLVAARRGSRPVLLLDEVAAHLDPKRRGALFERLAVGGGQVWMTGTEAALFADAEARRFAVTPGAVTPTSP